MMPGINGLEVLQMQRRTYPLEEMMLPIIMVSAKNQISSVVRGFELGCNDWIHKPFDRQDLAARVRLQLKLRDAVWKNRAEPELAIDVRQAQMQSALADLGPGSPKPPMPFASTLVASSVLWVTISMCLEG